MLTSLICKNQRFYKLFLDARGFELLKIIIEDKDWLNEIEGVHLCLLFKLASNSRPKDEVGSIEEMIEENEQIKPKFEQDKV